MTTALSPARAGWNLPAVTVEMLPLFAPITETVLTGREDSSRLMRLNWN
jgi:hypothetical protein